MPPSGPNELSRSAIPMPGQETWRLSPGPAEIHPVEMTIYLGRSPKFSQGGPGKRDTFQQPPSDSKAPVGWLGRSDHPLGSPHWGVAARGRDSPRRRSRCAATLGTTPSPPLPPPPPSCPPRPLAVSFQRFILGEKRAQPLRA